MKAYFLDGHNHKWFLFLCVFSLQDNVDHHSTKFSTSSSLCRSWFVFLSPFSLSSVLWESAFPRPLSMYQWNCDFLFDNINFLFFVFIFSKSSAFLTYSVHSLLNIFRRTIFLFLQVSSAYYEKIVQHSLTSMTTLFT